MLFVSPGVVTSASHDLALARHPVLSLELPAPPSILSLDTLHTHPTELFLSGHQPRDVIPGFET